jgi:hypothetical protein
MLKKEKNQTKQTKAAGNGAKDLFLESKMFLKKYHF